jgi:hypothetical protein
MEALALSRSVIATMIAGIPELVDGECGWLIPAGSEEALVQAMTDALHASPDELAALLAGRERFIACMTRHGMASLLSRRSRTVSRSGYLCSMMWKRRVGGWANRSTPTKWANRL